MKKLLLLVFLVSAPAALAQSATNQPAVVVRTEVEELAAGFAAGFKSIGSVPVFLTHVRGDSVTVIVSVKAVQAARGVLIVTLDSGQTYLLNPRDVISISDAPPQKG